MLHFAGIPTKIKNRWHTSVYLYGDIDHRKPFIFFKFIGLDAKIAYNVGEKERKGLRLTCWVIGTLPM